MWTVKRYISTYKEDKNYSLKNVSMGRKYATLFTSMIEIKSRNSQIIQLSNM